MKRARESMEKVELQKEQKEEDEKYMREALSVAEAALSVGEVPVGCVVVLRNHPSIPEGESVIISHGANQVNATRDATRHSEIVAIDRLLTLGVSSDQLRLSPDVGEANNMGVSGFEIHKGARQKQWEDRWVNFVDQPDHWKNSFGWRNNKDPQLRSKGIFGHCDLYVTCEPCVMCGELF
jgi:tRNA(Arg) A34 adenosine deaminase TadA